MLSNSNQPYGISIRNKRDSFKSQIRHQHLQQYFKAKRLQFFSTSTPQNRLIYYNQLIERIQSCPQQIHELDQLQLEVKALFNKNPEQSGNFVVVGCFLMKRPSKLSAFDKIIFKEENFEFYGCEEFIWCFGVYLIQLLKIVETSQMEMWTNVERADVFLGICIQNYFKTGDISQKSFKTIQSYVEYCRMIMELPESSYIFPINSFVKLINKMSQFYKSICFQQRVYAREIKIKISEIVCLSIRFIKERGIFPSKEADSTRKHFILSSSCMQKLVKCAAEVFYENIKDASDNRDQCLQSIADLTCCDTFYCGEHLFTDKLMEQLQFLLIHHKEPYRILILRSFSRVINSMPHSKIYAFLNNFLHINLAELLNICLNELHFLHQSSNQKLYSQSLHLTLKVIEELLFKVQSIDEKMFRTVVQKMDHNGFGDALQRMGSFRYDEQIEKHESNLIDLCFSKEADDEFDLSDCKDYRDLEQRLYRENTNKSKDHRKEKDCSEDLII